MPRWDSFSAFLAEALQTPPAERPPLVTALLQERATFPWVEGDQATFVYHSAADNVALNLDTIPSDPPFDPMTQLEGTELWYVTRNFADDDLLDYLIAVNDPGTPLAQETDIAGRIARHWRPDPLNPTRMETTQMTVSVLRMADARPLPDWTTFSHVPQGTIHDHMISSDNLGVQNRKVWVYTPPDYEGSEAVYPLLILHDGQWAVGPLQVPAIANTLIKHGRMLPTVIAMVKSGLQAERDREYTANEQQYAFLLSELLPLIQTNYFIDPTRVAVGGVAVGAVAAAHAALHNPVVFSRLVMISPPLGKGANQDKLNALREQFAEAEALPRRIFHSVGRYEAKARFLRPSYSLRDALTPRRDTGYRFIETGGGHGLVGFKSVLPEALSWTFPGIAEA